MKEKTISLIIPFFNEEKYIGTCLEYVIKNSNGRFLEIIVVDNASTDKTSEIEVLKEMVKSNQLQVRAQEKELIRLKQKVTYLEGQQFAIK